MLYVQEVSSKSVVHRPLSCLCFEIAHFGSNWNLGEMAEKCDLFQCALDFNREIKSATFTNMEAMTTIKVLSSDLE